MLGRLAADSVRVMFLTIVILAVGLFVGAGIASGPAGFVVIVLMAGVFGLAYSGIGMAIALRTGSAQAAQLGFLLFFPLIFLSPAFAPKEVFSGWMEFLATINPVTYIVEGMRSLVLEGWDWEALAYAVLAIIGFGAVTLSLTLMALRGRTALALAEQVPLRVSHQLPRGAFAPRVGVAADDRRPARRPACRGRARPLPPARRRRRAC